MSIILLLIPVVLWMAWAPQASESPSIAQPWASVIFLAGYAVVVAILGWRDRWRMRRLAGGSGLPRSARTAMLARLLVPAWFAVGIAFLGWRDAVDRMLGSAANWPVETPGLLLGILPVLLAWMGLWWAHYPVDRAFYEQNLLLQLDADLPLYAPPTFGEYLVSKLRMQILFTMVPVLMIVALRDAGGLIFLFFKIDPSNPAHDALLWGVSVVLVFLIVPEVLRRVLATESLPDTELRRRLWEIADRDRVRCRDVLLWRTHHTVGNAAVMGVVRWFRYVLLSDLLLESLPDEQVLAVFAHEVGHIIHRHMIWYAGFWIGLTMAFTAAADSLDLLALHRGLSPSIIDPAIVLMELAAIVIGFGYLSRRFERQADVHAARTMQALAEPMNGRSYVGVAGAAVFNSALLRVAEVNNIPTEARGRFTGSLRHRLAFLTEWVSTLAASWLHGTMASRVRYISRISTDANLTRRFDRQMIRLRIGIAAMLLLCVSWTAYDSLRTHDQPDESALQSAIGNRKSAISCLHSPAAAVTFPGPKDLVIYGP